MWELGWYHSYIILYLNEFISLESPGTGLVFFKFPSEIIKRFAPSISKILSARDVCLLSPKVCLQETCIFLSPKILNEVFHKRHVFSMSQSMSTRDICLLSPNVCPQEIYVFQIVSFCLQKFGEFPKFGGLRFRLKLYSHLSKIKINAPIFFSRTSCM